LCLSQDIVFVQGEKFLDHSLVKSAAN
jgi:hypothetical protein